MQIMLANSIYDGDPAENMMNWTASEHTNDFRVFVDQHPDLIKRIPHRLRWGT
jgi:hypothetical protein